jgi:hypothetical protein
MISILHPSYKRPDQAYQTYQHWLSYATAKGLDIEWIVALNNTDEAVNNYVDAFADSEAILISTAATNMVQATNAAASLAKYEILVLVSDDMYATEGWDRWLLKTFMELGQAPAVIQVHDGIRADICTLPIMNMAAYELLGYIYNPLYISLWADNDLAETAKAHGIYHAYDYTLADHRHYTNGKAKMDATYKKENSSVAWEHGRRTFERRKKLGFPL